MANFGSFGAGLGSLTGSPSLSAIFRVVDGSASGLRSADRSMRKFATGSGISGTQKALANLTRSGIVFAKLAGGFGASLAIAAASVSEFERRISGIAAIIGESSPFTENMQKLRTLAIDLSKEFAFTASEVAEGMRFIAQTGAKTNEILAATPAVLELATSTMENFDVAAKLTIRTLNAMGLELGRLADVRRVVNDLQFAVNNSVNTLTSLNDALKFSAPFAKTLGIELEDLISVLQFTADAGLEAGIAGRSLGQGLQQLIRSGMRGATQGAKLFANELAGVVDAGGTLSDIVEKLEDRFSGLSSGQLAQLNQLNDLTEAQIEQIESSNALGKTTGQLSELIQIFGVRGARVFAVLLGRSDELKLMRKSMELNVVTAAQQAQVALQNLGDQGKLALNKIRAGLLESDFATTLLTQLKRLNDSGDVEAFGEKLANIFEKLATDLGPALFDLIGVLTDAFATLTPFISTVVKLTSGMVKVMGALVNPLTVAAGGIFVATKFLKGLAAISGIAKVAVERFGAGSVAAGGAASTAFTGVNAQLAIVNAQLDAANAKLLVFGAQSLGAGGKFGAGGIVGAGGFGAGGVNKAGTGIADDFLKGAGISGGARGIAALLTNPVVIVAAAALAAGVAGNAILKRSAGNTDFNDPDSSILGQNLALNSAVALLMGPLGFGLVAANLVRLNDSVLRADARGDEIDAERNAILKGIRDQATQEEARKIAPTTLADGSDGFEITVGELETQIIRSGGIIQDFSDLLSGLGERIAEKWQDFLNLEIVRQISDGLNTAIEAISTGFTTALNAVDEFVFGKKTGVSLGADFDLAFGEVATPELLASDPELQAVKDQLIKDARELSKTEGLSLDDALQELADKTFKGTAEALKVPLLNAIRGSGDALENATFNNGVFTFTVREVPKSLFERTFDSIGFDDLSAIDTKRLAEIFATTNLSDMEAFIKGLSDADLSVFDEGFLASIADLDDVELTQFMGELKTAAETAAQQLFQLRVDIENADRELLTFEKAMITAGEAVTKASLNIQRNLVGGIAQFAQSQIDNAEILGLSAKQVAEAEERLFRAKAAQEVIAQASARTEFANLQVGISVARKESTLKSIEFQIKEKELKILEEQLRSRVNEQTILRGLFAALVQAKADELEAAGVEQEEVAAVLSNFTQTMEDLEASEQRILQIQEDIQDLYDDYNDTMDGINSLIGAQAKNWEELDDSIKKMLLQAGITEDQFKEFTEAEIQATFDMLLTQQKLNALSQHVQNAVSSAGTLEGALRNSRDSLINMGYSASAIDDALKAVSQLQFQSAVIGFLNNMQELAKNTGQDLSLLPNIVAFQEQALAAGADFLSSLISITGDPQSLAEIFARGSTVTQNVQNTTSINLQAELIFPEGITAEDREAIAAIAVDALGQAAADSPFYD